MVMVMVDDYLLDEMLSGNEAVCRNLLKQGKKVHRLPPHLKGQPDSIVVEYAKIRHYRLITRDHGCARLAQKKSVRALLLKD